MALRLRRKKGFGLIEVMVSVTILSIVMGAIFAVVNSALRETGDARNKDIAVGLAQEGLENVRLARDLGDPTSAAESKLSKAVRDISFTRTVTVKKKAKMGLVGSTDTLYVSGWLATATITWKANNRNLTYTAETFLREKKN